MEEDNTMNVEELLNKEGLEYRHSGADFIVHCLNPEHDDSNPSMRIDKIIGHFHCLSCGYKGNIFKYYDQAYVKSDILREQISRQIVEIRNELIGLQFPANSTPVDVDYRVPKEILQKFEAFTTIEKGYEGRIMFPIRDLTEKVVAFIGRTTEYFADEAKYKIYPAGAKLPLYPLAKVVPKQGRVILVEGIFDLVNMWDKGFTNTVCAFGINNINNHKLGLLRIRGVSGLDICFDPDERGMEAAEKVKELAEAAYMDVRVVRVKGGDPGDLTKENAAILMENLYG